MHFFKKNSEKVSEKSIEITTCAEISRFFCRRPTIWFGLTQKEEAQLGFDAAAEPGGIAFAFQFKASDSITQRRGPKGWRRFSTTNAQLRALQDLPCQIPRLRHRVFYALPDFGKWGKFRSHISRDCFLKHIWLLDVGKISYMPKSNLSNGKHRIFLAPRTIGPRRATSRKVEIHSERVHCDAYRADLLLQQISSDISKNSESLDISEAEIDAESVLAKQWKKHIGRNSVGMILLPQIDTL